MASGDLLILLTDGFFEWSNADGEQFGVDRLCDTIKQVAAHSPETVIAHIRNAVYSFVGDRPQDDDLTIVAIKKSDSE